MKRLLWLIPLMFLLVSCIPQNQLAGIPSPLQPQEQVAPTDNRTPLIHGFNSFKIANWNLQIFGDSKASDTAKLQQYADIISKYDIIFVQEIRDADGSAYIELCKRLPDFSCEESSRAGRSTSKEQYGIIYRKNLQIDNMTDYNHDSLDRWERPPVRVTFKLNNISYNMYNIHTKPDDVPNEMTALQTIATIEHTIILGDLNADCDYYNNAKETQFDSWNWIIADSIDTTSGNTNCAYDRIITTKDIITKNSGVEITPPELSDHYLVWVQI